jgi:hypothetical protein
LDTKHPVTRLALSIALAVIALGASPPDEPWFRVEPPEITAGNRAILSWGWRDAAGGYLSDLGLVEHASDGRVTVSPEQTTSYVLVLDAPGRSPRVLTLRLAVRGSKGSSGDWPSDVFDPLPYQVEYDIRSPSLSSVAARVRRALKARGFELRQFSQTEGQVVFATAFLQGAALNDPDENPRRFRRIAFRIAIIQLGSSTVHVNLSSSIQWRAVIDTRWFPEKSSSTNRYPKQTTDLWNAIQSTKE